MTAPPAEAAAVKCIECGCTEERPCPGGCRWVSRDPPLCSRCVTAISKETIAGALIDSARISVMAAMQAFPDSAIILPSEADDPILDRPTLRECLLEAASWLDLARELSIERLGGRDFRPSSLHVVELGRKT